MGLVSSFINQIGREIGKDTYRGAKNFSVEPNKSSNFINIDDLLSKVKVFEIVADEKSTLLKLKNLLELSENTNPEEFEWLELFSEIDNKIEFCKDHLSSSCHEQLERLDSINAENFNKIKSQHLRYIERIIIYLKSEQKKLESKNLIFARVISFLGLRPVYLENKIIPTIINVFLVLILVFVFAIGFKTYFDPIHNSGELAVKTKEQIEKVSRIGIEIMAGVSMLYLIYVVISWRKIHNYKTLKTKSLASIIQFENYLLSLKK